MTPLDQLRTRVPMEIAEEFRKYSNDISNPAIASLWEELQLKGYIAAIPRIERLEAQIKLAKSYLNHSNCHCKQPLECLCGNKNRELSDECLAKIAALDEKKVN